MAYTLVTYAEHRRLLSGLQVDNRIWPLTAAARSAGISGLPQTNMEIIENWQSCRGKLSRLARAIAGQRINPRNSRPVSRTSLKAPLLYPRKVICAGANYYDHFEEMLGGRKIKKSDLGRPYFFLKPPTTTIVGPGNTVKMPYDDRTFDWEIELAAVIGKRCREVPIRDAFEVVAAYTVAIDLTARDLQMSTKSPLGFDWWGGKSQDTHCPIGPGLVPADQVSSPQNLDLRLSVNGDLKQDSNTAGMIFSMAELISHASRYGTLEPGDLILTGTPAGVGFANRTFLKPGDRIVASIEQIGTLDVSVQRKKGKK